MSVDDSSDLEGLSTHDLVGMALVELGDQDADNGIPKQDVVKWVTSRTELVSADVHDAIGWLHSHGHVYEPRPDHLRRTDTEDDRWLAVAWHEALTGARVHAGDLDPKYLADRFDADTPDAVAKLVQQGVKEVIRSDNEKLTLDDLDEAEAKLEDSGFEVMTDGGEVPSDPERSLRAAVALDYIKDAQREWNNLTPEERHGSLEMARWVLEDAEHDEVREHDFYDESLESSSDIYRDDRTYDKCKWERAWGEFNAALHADRDSNAFLETVGKSVDSAEKEVLDDIIEVFDEIAEKHNVETFDECWNGEVEECDDHSIQPGSEQPEVVCLCGSTRFKDEYRAENRRLTMEGKIVLSVGLFGHADGHEFTDSEKQMLDDLHKQKIDLADRIHVINVDGYIGDSTQSEIEYARETRTEITYLEQPIATDGGAVEDGTGYRSLEEWHEQRVKQNEDSPFDVDGEYVVIEFDSGETYALVADRVAQGRASEVELPEHVDETDRKARLDFYQKERQKTLENPDLLVEWAKTEMSWSEIERSAIRIYRDEQPLAERLSDADIEVQSLQSDADRNGGESA